MGLISKIANSRLGKAGMVPVGMMFCLGPQLGYSAEAGDVHATADFIIDHGRQIGDKHSYVEQVYDNGRLSGSVYLSVKVGPDGRQDSFIIIVQGTESALILRDDNLDGLLDSSEQNGIPLSGKDAEIAGNIFEGIVGKYRGYRAEKERGI